MTQNLVAYRCDRDGHFQCYYIVDIAAEPTHGCKALLELREEGGMWLAACELRRGRGYEGRFVKKGSDDEIFSFDGASISRRDLKDRKTPLRFVGRVIGVQHPVESEPTLYAD